MLACEARGRGLTVPLTQVDRIALIAGYLSRS
jgi:hypothetical protein